MLTPHFRRKAKGYLFNLDMLVGSHTLKLGRPLISIHSLTESAQHLDGLHVTLNSGRSAGASVDSSRRPPEGQSGELSRQRAAPCVGQRL